MTPERTAKAALARLLSARLAEGDAAAEALATAAVESLAEAGVILATAGGIARLLDALREARPLLAEDLEHRVETERVGEGPDWHVGDPLPELHDEVERHDIEARVAAIQAIDFALRGAPPVPPTPAERFAAAILLPALREAVAFDVADLEDEAIAAGLAESVTVAAPCRDGCTCAEMTDQPFPAECLRLTPAGRRLHEVAAHG